MSEIDLTLALQLKAQFEEEARVSLLQQLAHQQSAEEEVLRQGALSTGSSSSSGRKQRRDENLSEPQQEKLPVPLVDPSWELIDPNPEVHALFLTFNHQFFWGRLAGVEVRWSPRMTLCAGVCSYEGRGGLCSVKLSVPLLKLRPRKDLIETLLHEMIHAYLFVTANNRDRDGHGPEFHKHMCRINNVAGTNISVYHSFHDEVDVYRQHVWRCNGSCRSRRPYFGLVKRAMNRAPSPRDPWWQRHLDACGGTYTKIQEPEGYGAKKQKKDAKKNGNFGDIRKFVEFKGKGNSISGPSSAPTGRHHLQEDDVSSKSRSAERPQVIDIASDIRAQKNIDFGVNRKTKSNMFDIDANKCNSVRKDRDNLFTGNGIRANDKRKNSIHELNNTATGSVKRVDVNNASKSNVHGFGGGGSPAMKKPKRGSGEVGKSGRGVGRVSGQVMHGGGGRGDVMEHGHGQDSNTRGGLTSVRGGRSRGGGLVMRGRGGSSTVTVKGRGITMTETRTDGADEVNKQSSQALFQGQGFSLGGGRMGVSRLLTLANSSLHSPPVSPPLQSCHAPLNSTVMSTSTSEPGSKDKGDKSVYRKQESQYSRSPSPEPDRGDSSKCPLCNTHIPGANLSQHLDDCMGMFDDRMSIDGENEDESMEIQDPRPHKVESESDDCLVIGAASGMSDEVEASGECLVGGTSRVLGEDGREVVYPCPVCGENYSQANINQHLDKHF